MDFETFGCGCVSNRFDDDLVRFQWDALPVSRDVAKESMLNLVPLARAEGAEKGIRPIGCDRTPGGSSRHLVGRVSEFKEVFPSI
jgi:hypothetical protein